MGVAIVPAAIFFLLFGTFVSQSIFVGLDLESSKYLGNVLSAFALGAIPLSINLVGIRVLNAYENTKLQAASNAVINIVAVLFSLLAFRLLSPQYVAIGLAASFAISYWIGFVVTDLFVSRFIGSTLLIKQLPFYFKLIFLALISIGSVRTVIAVTDIAGNFFSLSIVLLATSLTYLLVARLFKVSEVGEIMKSILRR